MAAVRTVNGVVGALVVKKRDGSVVEEVGVSLPSIGFIEGIVEGNQTHSPTVRALPKLDLVRQIRLSGFGLRCRFRMTP